MAPHLVDSALPTPYLVSDIDAGLRERPLDFLAAALFRVRIGCYFLELLTDDSLSNPVQVARGALLFFSTGWPNHVYQLHEGLFPLVMARTQVGDRVDQVMRRLLSTRRDDLRDLEVLKKDLHAILEGNGALEEDAISARLCAFARAQRRHAEWAEALVLPAARDCLNPADLATLARYIGDSQGKIISSSMLSYD